MEKDENKNTTDNIDKSQNILNGAKTSQNKLKDHNYKTSKSFYILPYLQSPGNNTFRSTFFSNNNKGPIINQQDYDPNLLKKELSLYKLDMHNRKNDLLKLKIKYSKLEDENNLNKNLISNILGVSLDKYITRDAILDRIENCELSNLEKEKLHEAYERIKLKLDISEKKSKISDQNNYIEELKKNSKTKIINEMSKDHYSKCEKQRELLRDLKKLEEKYDYYEKEIKKLNEYNEELKKNKTNLIQKENETKKKYDNTEQDKNNLIKQNKLFYEKIKKLMKTNR